MEGNKKFNTYRLVILGIFVAILIIQVWVPMLGYIMLPGVSLTIIHVTVILGTLLLGTRAGVVMGFIWGGMSIFRALTSGSPFEKLIFVDPLVSILPRMLMPLCIGLLADQLRRRGWKMNQLGLVAGVLGSLLNTVFVLGAIGLFKGTEYSLGIGIDASVGMWRFLMGLVIANGLPEAVVSGILTPILYRATHRFRLRARGAGQ